MGIRLILITCLGLAGAAHATPVTLVCDGTLTLDGKKGAVDHETAILDFEKRTFKPPMYTEFSLTRIGESDVSSIWGNLDRVSGDLLP
jgi:hypothetical protein